MTGSKKDTGGSAFPQSDLSKYGIGPSISRDGLSYDVTGMSLRDYFAAHAPAMPEQWFKDSPRKKSDPLWHWGEAEAAWRYFYADAMLLERSKGGA